MTKATSTVLGGSCADFNGDSEHILDSKGDLCACGKWHEAENERSKVDPQKHDVRHFLSVFQGVVTAC